MAWALAALLCHTCLADVWEVRRRVVRVREGPKPFHKTVARLRKDTRIYVESKAPGGRWLKVSGTVVTGDDARGPRVVPFTAGAGTQTLSAVWLPKLAVRPERKTPAAQAAQFTMSDLSAMRISVASAMRGFDHNASRLMEDQKVDPVLAQWIAKPQFTADDYDRFRGARNPDDMGQEIEIQDEDDLLDVDPEIFDRIGAIAAARMAEELGRRAVRDATLNAHVNMVAALVGEYSSRYDLLYRVIVVEHDSPNSYSRPGGYVAVTTGLLELCEDEDELAAVLGHEIAHISRDHGLKHRRNVQREIGIDIFGLEDDLEKQAHKLFGDDSKAFHTPVATGLVRLFDTFRGPAFSKHRLTEEEREADLYTLVYLARSGYDPGALQRIVQRLGQRQDATPSLDMACHDPAPLRLRYVAAGMANLQLAAPERHLGVHRQLHAQFEAGVKQRLSALRKQQGKPEPKPKPMEGDKPDKRASAKRDPFAELDALAPLPRPR